MLGTVAIHWKKKEVFLLWVWFKIHGLMVYSKAYIISFVQKSQRINLVN